MYKEVLASASYYNKKYFLDEKYEGLPTQVKNELRELCLKYVEAFKCIILIGFYEDGEIYIETQVSEENEFAFMEIDAKVEITKIEKEYSELFEGLTTYYLYLKEYEN